MPEQESPVGIATQLALSAPVYFTGLREERQRRFSLWLQLDKARLPEEATGKAWPVLISGHLRNCGSGSAAVLSWLKWGLYSDGTPCCRIAGHGLARSVPSQSQESSHGVILFCGW